MAKSKKQKVNPKIEIEFTVNGQSTKYSGESLVEAIKKIKPTKFTTRGILFVKREGKTASVPLNILQMRKIFGECGATTQEIYIGFIIKRVSQLLK